MAHDLEHAKSGGNGGMLLLGGLGLGALLMYLGDPNSGRRRRALIRDQYVHASRKVQHGADLVLRDATHRAHGTVAATRGWLNRRHEAGDDVVVVERLRSSLGRVTSHPHAVHVEARDGHVTLTGEALASEEGRIVACAEKCPGVKSVSNRLRVHESAAHIPALQGGRERNGSRPEFLQDNWSPAWRSLAGAIGAGLTLGGWLRGGMNGLLMGGLGSALVARAATNKDMKSLVGAGANGKGMVVQKAIHVNAPVDEVYRHWKVENFPQWMSHVKEVRPLADRLHHWVVEGPGGVAVEWDAEITGVRENEEMAWRSVAGSTVDNAGRVRFSEENGGTRVNVTLCYIPPGGAIGHAVAKALGSDPKSRMDDDLMRFKALIETGRPAHDAASRRQGDAGWAPSAMRH